MSNECNHLLSGVVSSRELAKEQVGKDKDL